MEVAENSKLNCVCDECGKKFHRKPSEIGQYTFCSVNCYKKYLKEKGISSKNKDYSDGKSKDIRNKKIGSRRRAINRYNLLIYRTQNTERRGNECYEGITVEIDKETFVTWFMENDFEGCSVDRIDKNKNYSMDNIQLIPLSENIRKDKVKAKDGMCECFRCKETKPLELFVKDKRRANGYTTICKECERIRTRERYKKQSATKQMSI